MTAVVETPGTPGAVGRAHPGEKVTLGRVLNSEWIKFRTLRSSFWSRDSKAAR